MEPVWFFAVIFGAVTLWKWFEHRERLAAAQAGSSELVQRVARLEQAVAEMRELVCDTIVAEHDEAAFRRLGEQAEQLTRSVDA